MKIAIPLDENRQDVCIVLARAPYFLFREDGMDTVLENRALRTERCPGVPGGGNEDPPVGPQDRRGGPGRAGGRGAGGTDPVPRRLPRCDMKIACLSGKGGAGKTLVAVNLAAAAGRATYLDCDVEEPNGRLFWKPQGIRTTVVHSLLPEFDAAACTGCKKCVEFCRFHALMYIREKPTVFPEVCHSCGGCQLVCPAGAVTETEKPVGRLEVGTRGDVRVVTGILNPGEASGIPVIRAVLKQAEGLTVIDCPPGSACSVMESIMDADLCILVAEPTAFGFHNFQMVYQLASLLGRRCGVVINKEDAPYVPLEDFCRERGLEILARIPYDPELAALAADGKLVWEKHAGAREIFSGLLQKIGGGA